MFIHRFTEDYACSCFWKVVQATCLRCFGGYEECLSLGDQFCWHPVLPDPTPQPRRAPRPEPPVVCPCFGLDKYELDCSCFRRDVQDSVFYSQGGKREGCLLAGSTRRRPVLPSPAPPRRPAVRRPDPTGPWCVRVLDSTGGSSKPFDCKVILRYEYSSKIEIFFEDGSFLRRIVHLRRIMFSKKTLIYDF